MAVRRERCRTGSSGRVDGMVGGVVTWDMMGLCAVGICSVAIDGKRAMKRSGSDLVV